MAVGDRGRGAAANVELSAAGREAAGKRGAAAAQAFYDPGPRTRAAFGPADDGSVLRSGAAPICIYGVPIIGEYVHRDGIQRPI